MARDRRPVSAQLTPLEQRAPRVDRMEEEEAQTAPERASDPNYDEHEPTLRACPPVVEDEPLQMKGEEEAQAAPEETQLAEEEAQSAPEEAQMAEEETETAPEEAQMAEEEEAQTAPEEAQEEAQRQEEEEEALQMRSERSGRYSARAVRMQIVERQLRAARGRGNPLPEPVRSKMEAGLGADLSGVRIHTDGPAMLMTRMLNAKAFASGRDVFFSPHRYAPGTERGDHLIAHELAHTLQQGGIKTHEETAAQRVAEDDKVLSRPESLRAIRIARGEIGKINSKLHGPDGNRVGWERLLAIFRGAYGGDVIAPAVIKRIITTPDQLPHWCGVSAWRALREGGFPLPPWVSGKNMTKGMETRKPGELPQKGDIAYRQFTPGLEKPTNHQALVSGVESAETAAGKPFKSIKVRTIDGNTAGKDNLGGQVEEKWQPIGAWDAFFIPSSVVDMPPAELIETDRASEDLGPDPDAEEKAPEPETAAPEPAAASASGADADGPPVVEPEALAGPEADVAVEIPPAPDASVEAAAEVEKLSLEGSSDEALVGFMDASPSRMAASAPALGPALEKKTSTEKKEVAEKAPTLTAKTGGEVDPGVTAPEDLPIPADTTLTEGGKGPEVGKLTPDPYEEKGKPPSNAAKREEIRKQPTSGFLDWLRNQFTNLFNGLRTSDDSVNTSAGSRKRVALTGDADVGQMERQRQEGTGRLRKQRDEKVAAFKNHPGQSNIQPRKVEEARSPAVSPETSEPIEDLPPDDGVADFVAAALPKAVRDAADAKMAPDLHANLAEARKRTTEAAAKRDTDKDAEIAEAERKTAAASRDADEGQRKAVLAGRTDVARQQGEAITGAYDGVAEFAKDAGKRQADDQKTIADNVKREEGLADSELEKGEAEAKRIKTAQEAKARDQKEKLRKEKEKQGFWERAASAVKSLVDKIAEAIDDIFNALRSLVKKAIEAAKKAAIGLINAAREAVVKKLNDFRDWAKDKVDTYVKDRFPGLAAKLNKGIDATVDVAVDGVNAAADAAIETVEALADALGKALDRILAAFQAGLKAAVKIAGAVLTGDFAGALRIAIEAACEIAGIDPKPIFGFMERAGAQLTAILKEPGKFINNVMTALGMGVRGFLERIKQHLMTGLIEWLTGALSVVPITLPDKWDIKGIFSLVAQILGLTYENIKARIIRKFPKAAKIFDLVEKGFALIRKLLSKDFSALWEEVKASLANLKDTVIAGIRNWVIVNVIKEGVVWLLSLMNPASALVKALKLLYDLVMWLVERYEQIKTFVVSVYEAVVNIAAGILGPAAKAVEAALGRAVPVLISMFAAAIGLGGIGEAVKGVLEKISAPINKLIDALIDRVVAFAKKIWGKTKEGAKAVKKKAKETAAKVKEKIFNWWKEKRGFTSKDGGKHKIYYKGTAGKADLWIASTPSRIEAFLAKKKADAKEDADQRKVAGDALAQYKLVLKSEAKLEKLRAKRSGIPVSDKKRYRAATSAVESEIRVFRNQLDALSKILAKATFEDESIIQTKVDHSGSGQKNTRALPLTHLSGNTKGSSPSQDPPGWDHAVALDTKPDGTSRNQWVRGHLLNDNLHGPGTSVNLVPITQKMNRSMETKVEGPAKAAIRDKDAKLYYKAEAKFWSAPDPVGKFPQSITVEWGESEKTPSGFVQKKKRGGDTFTMPTQPPATAAAFVPSINDGSPGLLLKGIRKHGPTTTSYFVSNVLLAEYSPANPYSSKTNMRQRLYTNKIAELEALGGTLKADRKTYVDATYKAITVNDVRV